MTVGYPDIPNMRTGGKRLLSRVLTRIETGADDVETVQFLDRACAQAKGHVLGLTGPPGVGKSTLTDALIKDFRAGGQTVAVLAIDPSSSITGGALLGDRTRLNTDPDDDQVFVRSMAARDRLGGLSDHSVAAIAVLRAVFDCVLVETVGIGQSEGDLKKAADTVVLCVQPGSGDSLQFMKAGIMELPDIVAVTKSDMGPPARRAASDVAGALSLTGKETDKWSVPVCQVSSRTGEGVPVLVNHVGRRRSFLMNNDVLECRRKQQHHLWFLDMVQTEFGQSGLTIAAEKRDALGTLAGDQPFSCFSKFSTELREHLNAFD